MSASPCLTWCPRGGQRAAFGNALCAQWAPVLKFRSSGLLRSASALWAISSALQFYVVSILIAFMNK